MNQMKVNCHQIEQQECVETCELPQVPRTRGEDDARGDDEWTESHVETMAKIRAVITFVIAQAVRQH